MKDLIYVTGNKYKIFTAIETYGINVIGKKIDCIEIQEGTIEEVARFSSKYASDKLNCAVLKNDMGLVIPSLKGFPSAYTHYADDTITEDGILKLMKGIENREAYFLECLAYTEPGKETKVFYSKTEGTIDTKKVKNMAGVGIEYLFLKEKKFQCLILMIMIEQNYGAMMDIKS